MGVFKRMKANRTERQAVRKQRKTARRTAKVKRQATRQTTRQRRLDAKATRQAARQAKRLSKYAPEVEPQVLEETAALTPVMAEELQEQGVYIENPDDTEEVLLKYTQTNPDIENPMSDEEYESAFLSEEEDFDSHIDWQKALTVGKAAAKGALGGAASSMNQYTDKLAQKNPDELTASERKVLNAKSQLKGYIKDAAVDDVMTTLKPILMLLAIVIVLYILFKKVA